MIGLPGYAVSDPPAWRTASFTYYRGVRTSDGRGVILKEPVETLQRSLGNAGLWHEYRLLLPLELPNVLQPIAIERTERSNILVYQDFAGLPLSTQLENLRGDRVALLEMFIVLAKAVGGFHDRDIVHGNLRPEYILYNPREKAVRITNFVEAVDLSKEYPGIREYGFYPESFAFISPEQTGKTNRSLDIRSDLYTLGVLFYHGLTGKLPYQAETAVEWGRAHIFGQPTPLHEVDPTIPESLSAIILKLLAKLPHDRYHGAAGLIPDLETVRDALSFGRVIDDFEPGARDSQLVFCLSQKLYGTEAEFEVLQRSFKRVKRGRKSVVLISGDSGVGKSRLARELGREVIARGGHFVSGRFDQLTNEEPYSALVQAFRDLIRQVSGEGGQHGCRKQLMEQLGANVAVLCHVIPEVIPLVGDHEPVKGLPPQEARARFEAAFTAFISVFAGKEHPLVISIEDLHWADTDSLRLIRLMSCSPHIRGLMLIGTYPNYISTSHPLHLAADQMRAAGATMESFSVKDWNLDQLAAFIADSLNCDPNSSMDLSTRIWEKTHGNPFFTKQLLASLHAEGLLHFDKVSGRWAFDANRIDQFECPKNVVAHNADIINRMEERGREILIIASVIGPRFRLDALARLAGRSQADTAEALRMARDLDLIRPVDAQARSALMGSTDLEGFETYHFADTHILQAAYSLVPPEQKPLKHLEFGRDLERSANPNLFDVAHHLNAGAAALTDPEAIHDLVELNLKAGKIALGGNASTAALGWFRQGLRLMPASLIDRDYNLAYNLTLACAECAYRETHFEEAERLLTGLFDMARSNLDKARVLDLRIILCTNQGRNRDGIQYGLTALKILGLEIPDLPEDFRGVSAQITAEIAAERELANQLLAGRSPEQLLDLPEMENPECILAVKLITDLFPLINQSFSDKDFLVMLVFKGVNATLREGNSVHSALCYSFCGMCLCSYFNDCTMGHAFGRLALDIVKRYDSNLVKCAVSHIFGSFINHWKQQARSSLKYLADAERYGAMSGGLIYRVYVALQEMTLRSILGDPLDDMIDHTVKSLIWAKQAKYNVFVDYFTSFLLMYARLKGEPVSNFLPGRVEFDEDHFMDRLQAHESRIPLAIHYYTEAKTNYLLGRIDRAYEMSHNTDAMIGYLSGSIVVVEHYFYQALITASKYDRASKADRGRYLKEMLHCSQKMAPRADQCGVNFQHKYLLVQAERARISECYDEALTLFRDAEKAAHANGYPIDGAQAAELEAYYHTCRGDRLSAQECVGRALAGYEGWGAAAVAAHLRDHYHW